MYKRTYSIVHPDNIREPYRLLETVGDNSIVILRRHDFDEMEMALREYQYVEMIRQREYRKRMQHNKNT